MKVFIFYLLMFLSCLFISFISHYDTAYKKKATGEVAYVQQQQRVPKLLMSIARKTMYFYTGDTLFSYEKAALPESCN